MKVKVSISVCGVEESYNNPAIITIELPPEISRIPDEFRKHYVRRFIDDKMESLIDYSTEEIE